MQGNGENDNWQIVILFGKGKFFSHQRGFRNGRGILDSIESLKTDKRKGFINKESVIAVVFDIEKHIYGRKGF